jgi:hypothetical protein
MVLASVGCDRTAKITGERDLAGEKVPGASQGNPKTLFPRNDWPCTADSGAKITRWYDRWMDANGAQISVKSVTLVQHEGDGGVVEDADVFELSPTALTYDDGPVVSVEALGDLIESMRRQRERMDALLGHQASGEQPVYLAIDENVSLTRVLEVLTWLKTAGIEGVSFVFQAPEPFAEFEVIHPEVKRRVEAVREAETRTRADGSAGLVEDGPVVSALRAASEDCAPIVEVWAALESRPPELRARFVRDHLADAWLACDCRGDLELILGLQSASRPVVDAVPARFVSVSVDRAMELGADTDLSWMEFVRTKLTAR